MSMEYTHQSTDNIHPVSDDNDGQLWL